MISPAPKSVLGLCCALAIRVPLPQAVPAILVALHFLTLGLHGQGFIVPASMATNDVAFGSGTFRAGNFRIQEVYAGSAFSSPSDSNLIRELRWRPDYVYGNAFTSTLAHLEVRLSTTTRLPDGLSAFFHQNTGTNEVLVFSGPITLSSRFFGPVNGPKAFDIVLPLQTSFLFKPADGNLLIDIINSSGSFASPLAGQAVLGDAVSRVSGTATFSSGSPDTGGEVIKFICDQPTNSADFLVDISPAELWVETGYGARFDASVFGDGPFWYLWRHNGDLLSGQTNSSLLISNVQPDDAGTYEVAVSNLLGFVTNAMAHLHVLLGESNLVLPNSAATNDVAFGSGTFRTGGRVQFVFGTNGFSSVPGPKLIRELRWRPDSTYGNPFSVTLTNLEIRLATTLKQPDGLSSTFLENTTTDEKVVFLGPATISSQFIGPANGPKLFDIVVPLQTPFFYVPSRGNLLIDVRTGGKGGASFVGGQAILPDGSSRVGGPISSGSGSTDTGADAIKLIFETRTNRYAVFLDPSALSLEVGESARFDAYAFGEGRFSFQWSHEGSPLAGQTNSFLSFTNLQVVDRGNYQVAVTNESGFFTNAYVQLQVAPRSVTLVLPASLSTNDASYGASTLRTGNLRIQQAYSGAGFLPVGPALIKELRWRPDRQYGGPFDTTLQNVQITLSTTPRAVDGLSSSFSDNVGTDQVTVFTDSIHLSSAFSGPAVGPKQFDIKIPLQTPFLFVPTRGNLLVDVANISGSIASLVSGQSVYGDEGSRVAGSASGTNGSADSGVDAMQFVVEPVTNGAYLFVTISPTIATRPVESSVQFEVVAFGAPPFGYRWRHDNAWITGATNPILVLTNLQTEDSGTYEAVVTNAFGLVTNATAQLTVTNLVPPALIRGPYVQCVTTSNGIVRWRTHLEAPGLVRFGLTPDVLQWECSHGMVTNDHLVTLTNLAPSKRYFYNVWAGTNLISTGTNNYVQTAPTTRVPTRIWAIGDAGTMTRGTTNSLAVRNAYLQHSQGRHTDVWLMLGDNAYYSGTDGEYQIAVFNIYPTLLPNSPVWPTVGNHDAESLAMLNIFSLPTQGEAGGIPSGSELYYSFNYGNIHFVCLDSEVTGKSPGDPQLLWLEQDLAANTNDWVIAYWHSPPYSRGSHHSDYEQNLVQMREWVVPILENYGVDLVLCGHSHSYERSYLLDGHYGSSATLTPSMIKDGGSGRTNDTGAYRKPSTGPAGRQGAVYVVAGSSGQTSGVSSHPAMFVYLNRLGSMVIDIDGDRLDARFLRETGAVDDHFTILKGAAPEPLHIATFRSTGGTVTARWKSVAGYIYRIECSPSLEPAQWNTVAINIMATGATTSWSGPTDSPTGSAYYRVVQVSP